MHNLEAWLVELIKAPQFPWIALMVVGLLIIEVVLHNSDGACKRMATGVSSCFGVFCVYALTSILFGPIHHSLLETLDLSSCLPFLADNLITTKDWAIFSILEFPDGRMLYCYGLLELFFICFFYNIINDIIEKAFAGKPSKFAVWGIVQVSFIVIFTIIISSFSYIRNRIVVYMPTVGKILDFIKREAPYIFVTCAVILFLAIVTEIAVCTIAKEKKNDIPVLSALASAMFEKPFGVTIIKAVVTEYFLMILFKLISITYIKNLVFNASSQFVVLALFVLIFMWYMIRQEVYKSQ